MNSQELLRLVDTIHRDKKLDKEVIFQSIEASLIPAIKKRYGDSGEIVVKIDHVTGEISASYNGQPIPVDISERTTAQTAKQVMIQKIRDAECDKIFNEYSVQKGQLITGVVHRCGGRRSRSEDDKKGKDEHEVGTITVTLPDVEAVLPISEQIRKDNFRVGDRIRALVADVRKQGSRVKVLLSRIRPLFVTRLFEQEIPEIAEGVIEIRNVSRKPGVRSKIAVWSADKRVDCVGACIGVHGSRIRNIMEELVDERIDVVPWTDDMMEMIPNALQPAEVKDVILCEGLGRAIVLVDEKNLSLAIGRFGQNVQLASKLCGWDINVMTEDELQNQLEQASQALCTIDGITPELADILGGDGYMSYDDLSIIEPDYLMEVGGLTEEQANAIIEEADRRVQRQEIVTELCVLDSVTQEVAEALADNEIFTVRDITTLRADELAQMCSIPDAQASAILSEARSQGVKLEGRRARTNRDEKSSN